MTLTYLSTGGPGGSLAVGGSIGGATPSSLLETDGSNNLQSGVAVSEVPVASSGATPNQIVPVNAAVTKEAPVNPMHPDFGALFNNSNDDTAAINAAIAYASTVPRGSCGQVFIPNGTAHITSQLSCGNQSGLKIFGESRESSFIKQMTDGLPIIEWNATSLIYGCELSNLRLEHANQQTTASNPNAAAIHLTTTNANGIYYNAFRNLVFNQSCYMILVGGTTPFWNNRLDDLIGANISGSLIAQASVSDPTNHLTRLTHVGAAVAPTGYALSLGGEWEIGSLDIEDWTDGILTTAFADCRVVVSSMHLERHKCATNGKPIIYCYNSNFDLNNIYGSFQLNNTGAYYFIQALASSNLRVGNLETRWDPASTGSGTMRAFNFPDATCQITLGPRKHNSSQVVDWQTSEAANAESVISDRGAPPSWDSSVALPVPSSTYRGRLIQQKGTNATTADQLYVCQQSAAGTYSWVPASVPSAPLIGGPPAYSNFVGETNASPATLDSGQAVTLTGTKPLAIVSGALTFATPPAAAGAGYLMATLPAQVKHVGATFQLTQGSTAGGGVVLGAFDNANGPSGSFNANGHLTICQQWWQFGTWAGAVFTNITTGLYFDIPLPANKPLRVDMFIDTTHGTATLLLPDHSVRVIQDVSIRNNPACLYPFWECIIGSTYATDSTGTFTEIYAESTSDTPMPNRAPSAPVNKAIPAVGRATASSGSSYRRPASSRAPGMTYWDETLGKLVTARSFNSGGGWWDVASGLLVGNLLTSGPSVIDRPPSGVWSPSSSTASWQQTTVPPGRTTSLALTATSTTNISAHTSVVIPVTAGLAYSAVCRRFMTDPGAAAARQFYVQISWQQAGGTGNGSVAGVATASSQTAWTPSLVVAGIAPANTVQALVYIFVNSAVSGEIFYANEFCLAQSNPAVGIQATSAASGTGAVTSLTVTALTQAVPSGMSFQIVGDTNSPKITFTTTAVAIVGATALAVTASPSVTTTIAAGNIVPLIADFIEP